eukprot:scaffold3734_cov425-Prasinococcus_capsulatus_cf.AAC.12
MAHGHARLPRLCSRAAGLPVDLCQPPVRCTLHRHALTTGASTCDVAVGWPLSPGIPLTPQVIVVPLRRSTTILCPEL